MNKKEHLQIENLVLTSNLEEVHDWLDDNGKFDKNKPFKHWLNTHYLEAIEKKWGENTREYLSACLHVIIDFLYHFNVVCSLPYTKEELRFFLKVRDEL